MRIHAVKLGLATGILWGLFLFLTTWLSMYTGYGMFWLSQWIDLYPGYDISFVGSFLGLLYGFVDGFISLFVLSWLYNLFLGKSGRK